MKLYWIDKERGRIRLNVGINNSINGINIDHASMIYINRKIKIGSLRYYVRSVLKQFIREDFILKIKHYETFLGYHRYSYEIRVSNSKF